MSYGFFYCLSFAQHFCILPSVCMYASVMSTRLYGLTRADLSPGIPYLQLFLFIYLSNSFRCAFGKKLQLVDQLTIEHKTSSMI